MDLTLETLTCRRAGRLIFDAVSFHLPAGQAAALRGPNGVGKSTLLRQLAGFLSVLSGDARLGGISLASDRGGFQEHIAYAGHQDAVKPALTVRENLAVWARINGSDRTRVDAALARFGLARIAARPVAQCSAGQRRRLGLARLLLVERTLWLLDEPTVSLDAEAAATVAELVDAHLKAGGNALIATHADLGLGEIDTLTLRPAPTEAGALVDPFLAENWL